MNSVISDYTDWATLIEGVEQNIRDNRQDITDLLSVEILKRYYYQKGEIIYSLRDDHDLDVVLSLLHDTAQYKEMLLPPAP